MKRHNDSPTSLIPLRQGKYGCLLPRRQTLYRRWLVYVSEFGNGKDERREARGGDPEDSRAREGELERPQR